MASLIEDLQLDALNSNVRSATNDDRQRGRDQDGTESLGSSTANAALALRFQLLLTIGGSRDD
jgi:hypothetical protein